MIIQLYETPYDSNQLFLQVSNEKHTIFWTRLK